MGGYLCTSIFIATKWSRWLLWTWKHPIWKQGTSSKNLLLFPEIMLWNEDVPLKTCNLCVEVAPCRHMRQVTGRPPRKGGNNTTAKQPLFPSETSCRLTGITLLNLWDASVPDVLYTFFGNHYYLLNKWATTLTGWRDFQQCSMPAQNDIWRSLCSATNDAKNLHNSLQSL